MTDFQIIPFEHLHLQSIELQAHEKEMLNIEKFLSVAADPLSGTWTCVYKNHVLGIGGYYTLWPHVVEGYIIPSIYLPIYPRASYLATIKWIQAAKDNLDFHRIQTASLDDPRRSNFMEHLGFKREGVLKNYTSKKDSYIMWAYTRD